MEIVDQDFSLIYAKELLGEIYNEYEGIFGGIFVEEPPCLTSSEFIEMVSISLI